MRNLLSSMACVIMATAFVTNQANEASAQTRLEPGNPNPTVAAILTCHMNSMEDAMGYTIVVPGTPYLQLSTNAGNGVLEPEDNCADAIRKINGVGGTCSTSATMGVLIVTCDYTVEPASPNTNGG